MWSGTEVVAQSGINVGSSGAIMAPFALLSKDDVPMQRPLQGYVASWEQNFGIETLSVRHDLARWCRIFILAWSQASGSMFTPQAGCSPNKYQRVSLAWRVHLSLLTKVNLGGSPYVCAWDFGFWFAAPQNLCEEILSLWKGHTCACTIQLWAAPWQHFVTACGVVDLALRSLGRYQMPSLAPGYPRVIRWQLLGCFPFHRTRVQK